MNALWLFDLYCNYVVSVILSVCFIEETCRLVAKCAEECGLQRSSTGFCSTQKEGWICYGQGPWLLAPLIRGEGARSGRDELVKVWHSLVEIKGHGTLTVMIKGKSCVSAESCSITRNEWILGQKPWKHIAWLGTRLMQCRIPLTKAAVSVGVHIYCLLGNAPQSLFLGPFLSEQKDLECLGFIPCSSKSWPVSLQRMDSNEREVLWRCFLLGLCCVFSCFSTLLSEMFVAIPVSYGFPVGGISWVSKTVCETCFQQTCPENDTPPD